MCWSRSSISWSASCRCTASSISPCVLSSSGRTSRWRASWRWSRLRATGDDRVEALRLAEAFRANVIDANTEHFIFEITGKVSKIEQFIAIMKPLGLVEVCRTGVAAMNRGPQGM